MPRGFAPSRKDANHPALVAHARSIGLSVFETHALAGGLDLIVGLAGTDQRVEIKDPAQPPSARKLTKLETETFDLWRGRPPVIWMTTDDVEETRRQLLGVERCASE